ncbi:colicin V production CvpA [Pokkaliibacter plantistimulans]|uniref:Colicin V production CvpA n=2 Tax=Pseudomonadota TaxID=1224 RepID=A0ABX5LW93_9GAMM|nr:MULTISPECIES: CvpA family protein [Pokkaliibacter]MDH2435099.1 CvpA family protein [Pokkaliibacter sp. MBI-7]PPC77229.1 colicin V production CvpA [Pokkaliibacter plantistimulans]PXF30482.1 colicin V production CvpA [Pokkaliibacter plantistimulans]
MNWADWVILGVIGVSGLISLTRGFMREALSLLTWIVAFVIARLFTDQLSVLLTPYIATPSIRVASAFIALFIITLIVGAMIGFLVGELVKATGLSGTDRVLGMAFGIARGCVLIVVAVALLSYTPVVNDYWWQSSRLVPEFKMMESWSLGLLKDVSGAILSVGS